MENFKDYTRALSVIFMGIGFVLAFIGFYTLEAIFYIAIGWEVATVIIMLMMQESLHEWLVLKKKTRLATKAQKVYDDEKKINISSA